MTAKRPRQRFMRGYCPVVRARQGLMIGILQPLDGPVFMTLGDAIGWSIDTMVDHYERRLGMSDATIQPFAGMVDCGTPPEPGSVEPL